jgi:hypothetical protein
MTHNIALVVDIILCESCKFGLSVSQSLVYDLPYIPAAKLKLKNFKKISSKTREQEFKRFAFILFSSYSEQKII